MEKALEAYRAMAKSCPGIGLCASFGLLEENDFVRLREAGVTRYHANIETSRRNFPNICTTHTFEQKLEVIRRAKRAGLKVCSGAVSYTHLDVYKRQSMSSTPAEVFL